MVLNDCSYGPEATCNLSNLLSPRQDTHVQVLYRRFHAPGQTLWTVFDQIRLLEHIEQVSCQELSRFMRHAVARRVLRPITWPSLFTWSIAEGAVARRLLSSPKILTSKQTIHSLDLNEISTLPISGDNIALSPV